MFNVHFLGDLHIDETHKNKYPITIPCFKVFLYLTSNLIDPKS
jgi:hypothetical protein